MPKVRFVKENREIEVPEGSNLRQAALDAGIQVYRLRHRLLNCHGRGKCGTCRVLIRKGMQNASPISPKEQSRLRLSLLYTGNPDQLRLSCQTQVLGDMEVETAPEPNLHGEAFWE